MRFNELIAGVRGDIAIKVFGDDFGEMNATANRIAGILRATRGAADVRVEQTEGLPMLDIRPNRTAMSRVGVTAGDVQDTVAAAIGGRQAGVIFEGDRRFPVVIRMAESARSDLTAVAQVPVPTAGGGFVPLSTVADIAVVDGPNQISRENGKRRCRGAGERPRPRRSRCRRRCTRRDRRQGEAAPGHLSRMGWPVREFGIRARQAGDRRPDLLRRHHAAALRGARLGTGRADRIHRRATWRWWAVCWRWCCEECRSPFPQPSALSHYRVSQSSTGW